MQSKKYVYILEDELDRSYYGTVGRVYRAAKGYGFPLKATKIRAHFLSDTLLEWTNPGTGQIVCIKKRRLW